MYENVHHIPSSRCRIIRVMGNSSSVVFYFRKQLFELYAHTQSKIPSKLEDLAGIAHSGGDVVSLGGLVSLPSYR